jgi:hypothetical protein
MTIQRAWRSWIGQRKRAVMLIEASVFHWMYKVDGLLYRRAKADFERLARRIA